MKKLWTSLAALALGVTLMGGALAETIQPNPMTLQMDQLQNRFVLTDIQDAGEGKAELTVYETELFTAEAIQGLKAGDTIVTSGISYTVATVATDEYGDIMVNQDTAEELRFTPDHHGNYAEIGDDDVHPQLIVGKVTLEISDFITVLDYIDPATGEPLELPVVYSGEQFNGMLKTDEVGFNAMNTYVLYGDNGEPRIIARYYTPWQ